MKAVIALVIAVALLAIGIPLSRAISDRDEHTITRTIDPAKPTEGRKAEAMPTATGTGTDTNAASQAKTGAVRPATAKR